MRKHSAELSTMSSDRLTVVTRGSMSFTRVETRHRHPTTRRSLRFPSDTNSSANSSSNAYNPHWNASLSVDHAGFRPGYSTTVHTCTHFSNSDTGLPGGTNSTNNFGSQPLTSKRHPTQLSTATNRRLHEIKAWRSPTHKCPQSCTTNDHRQRTRTSKSHLKRATTLETRSARCCSTPISDISRNHCLSSGTFPNMTARRTFPTPVLQTTFFPPAAHSRTRPPQQHTKTRIISNTTQKIAQTTR